MKKAGNHRAPWTKKDIERLEKLGKSHTASEIAYILGRTIGAVQTQARERGIHLIWIEHDLMDPRTVSRKAMRDRVNRYMITVFRAEPLDPSLVDYDDDLTW